MRRLVAIGFMLVGSFAFATPNFGTSDRLESPLGPPGTLNAQRVSTIGPATALRLRAAQQSSFGAQRTLVAADVRTGQQFAPGSWRIEFWEAPSIALLATWTQTLAPNAWNELRPPQPISFSAGTGHALDIVIAPVDSADMEFISSHWWMGPFDVQWHGGYFADPPGRFAVQQAEGIDDAGVVRSLGGAVLVLEFSDRPDPFAPPECGDAGEVSGNPYYLWELRDAGAASVQTWRRVINFPETARLRLLNPQLAGGGPITYTLERNGAVIGTSPGPSYFGSCVLMPSSGVADMYRFTIIALDGGISAFKYSAGRGLSSCDPVARATWGGSQSNSDGEPGEDLDFGAFVEPAPYGYADLDDDGFGAADGGAYVCSSGLPIPGWMTNADDCDDRRYDVHPDASEICDGIDQNCNGIVDDNVTDSPRCEKFQGVCSGAMKPASLCVDGGWAACGPTEYGPLYESPEPVACDGVDNDCDGTIAQKHRCERQLGPCRGKFVDVCFLEDGACKPSDYGPWFEDVERTCDGIDNDCDGETDGLDPDLTAAPSCALQQGVCAGSHASSAACTDAGWAECSAADYGSDYEAVESRCDGLDNDCDGLTDEACLAAPPSARNPCGCNSVDALTPLALAAIAWMLRARSRGHDRID